MNAAHVPDPNTLPARGGPSSRLGRMGWTPARVWVALLLVAGGVLSTLDAWTDIVHIVGRDDEASQVYLAPVVAAWLFWIRRDRLRGYVPGSTWIGPVLVAAGWVLHRVGDLQLYQSMWHFGAVVVVCGCFLSVAGGGFLYRFLPVFAALCFLVPVPGRVRQSIAVPLQSVSANVTQELLDMIGMQVERSGNLLRVNGQDVMVAEACNGLRLVFSLVIVSFAFAYGVPLRNWVRLLVVAVSPVTAVVFNVVRLVPVVWVYGHFPSETGAFVHDVSAWMMLPLAFLTLLGVMRLLRWAQVPITPYILAYGS
jgi:exosortase